MLAYIDNIFINKDVVLAESVRKHLKLYRLTSKDPEKLQNKARVLGLEVWGSVVNIDGDEEVVW